MMNCTPLIEIDKDFFENTLFIKRDDLIPYSFGGNKARKGKLFFDEIDLGGYDCVVTYGSSHSNHCRIIANMAAARGLRCFIIAPSEVSDKTFNTKFMELFGAEIIEVPVENVHDTIEFKLTALRQEGKKPYFIPGGGHGNIGTQAYVDCYHEICSYEKETQTYFDYIFFASGTGTTHSGLVCGQILNHDNRKIIGISIARKNPRGRDVVLQSIRQYLEEQKMAVSEEMETKTIFEDDYIGDGYGGNSREIIDTIKSVMISYGVPLDSTYTGKAFWGMKEYIKKHKIKGKKILFIHTGGTPLFFNDMERF